MKKFVDILQILCNQILLQAYVKLRGDMGDRPPLETGVGSGPPWQKKIVPPLRVKKD